MFRMRPWPMQSGAEPGEGVLAGEAQKGKGLTRAA